MVRTIPKRKIARALARQNGATFQVGEWAHFDKECEHCCAVEIKEKSNVKIVSALSVFKYFPDNYEVQYTTFWGGLCAGWVCAHHLTKVKRKKGLK